MQNQTDNLKPKGHYHLVSRTIREINDIFAEMGFAFADGPEIEEEYYNFDALNIPEHHPARDMWDTFWLKPLHAKKLLRTHTSPVQVRYMESHQPPLRIIAPGKTFRYEATDATHEAQFYQLEGLAIGKDISLANLKGTLEQFLEKYFGKKAEVRFRPSYFPFVEPGVEVDMACFKCNRDGSSCPVCKGAAWVEILGAGLVHRHVLEAVGFNPDEWSGFAFGAGIDRLIMLKYGVPDVRMLYSADLKLNNQF